jgi:hypothetical protein
MEAGMKTIKMAIGTLTMLAALSLLQGCFLLLVGGAAAGAAYGTVKYVNNTLQVTQNVNLDKAWQAANAALQDLQMPVTESNKDGASGKLKARNAQNQPVTVQLLRKTDTVTEIQITVGTFDSRENRTEARQIYDEMHAKF